MSKQFRDLLRKVGSGPHTGKNLSREEAAQALALMLTAEATPAQIGAFLIAHRIKRPTGEELAGMLDTYERMGPQVPALASGQTVVILSQPYDGRSRTCPLSPLTALVLASADCPVMQHGGDRLPTKEGLSLLEIWQGLGVDWRGFSLAQIHDILAGTNLGFVYLREHFPEAQTLVPYREQIGKRPPLATLELIWAPYSGPFHVVAGFVHPPTETFIETALRFRGVGAFTTVKGLEGSCDLPRERTALITIHHRDQPSIRLRLQPRDYGLGGKNPPLEGLEPLLQSMQAVLAGEQNELAQSVAWNGGFYLWQHGGQPSLEAGIDQARTLLRSGLVAQKLKQVGDYAKSLQ